MVGEMKLIFVLLFTLVKVCHFYQTCDFDLPPRTYIYLPEECQLIFKEGGEKFNLAKREAILFKEFYTKLRKYEDENKDTQWEYKMELYNATDLYSCSNMTAYPGPQHKYKCLIPKREQMIDTITPKVQDVYFNNF